jgi:hypothetical protein
MAAGQDDRSFLATNLSRTTAIRTMLAEVAQSGEIWLPTRESEEFLGPLFLRGMQRLHRYVIDRAASLAEIENDAELLAMIRGYFRRVLMGYARKDAYADLRRENKMMDNLHSDVEAQLPSRPTEEDLLAADEAKRLLIETIQQFAADLGKRDQTIIAHKREGRPSSETASALGMTVAALNVAVSRLYARIRLSIPPHLIEDLFPGFEPPSVG